MRDLRASYFLIFAVLGAVLPYATIYFQESGLSPTQVGYAFAIWSGASIASPVLVAWAADAALDPRRLVLLCSGGAGACLVGLGFVRGVGSLFAVWTAYCAISTPLLPLLDGIYFGQERVRTAAGEPPRAYHRVRVWGTVGYLLPAAILFEPLRRHAPAAYALMSGAAFAAVAALHAQLVADPRLPGPAGGAVVSTAKARLPTAAAARVLFRPQIAVFCAALFLGQMASYALAAFFPQYLTKRVGMDAGWAGAVSNFGVVIEVLFVLGAARMTRALGVKGMIVVGLAATAVRLGMLAAVASVAVALASVLVHGLLVVVLGVLPQPFLDRYADDGYRHSVQGVFVMLMGFGKVAGSLAAGLIAQRSLEAAFAFAAGLCVLGAALAAVAFRERRDDPVPPPADAPGFEAMPTEAVG
ncbi:MAG TPA: MFS transporter [Humisphaera sp.]